MSARLRSSCVNFPKKTSRAKGSSKPEAQSRPPVNKRKRNVVKKVELRESVKDAKQRRPNVRSGPKSRPSSVISHKVSKKEKDQTHSAKQSNKQHPHPKPAPTAPIPPLPHFKKIKKCIAFCRKDLYSEPKILSCDCSSKKEQQTNDMGCGADCQNRVMSTECLKSCPTGEHCTNRRFQKREYADIEPFFTGPAKGWGVRARSDISRGQFIIEYVGDVVGLEEMVQRIDKYANDPNHNHHYLMALSDNVVIDATLRGNNARFVNHSCDPNAETQKWNVCGQLRVGFFATKCIKAGEEICVDYRLECYGKKAQQCFCGTTNCTGYIGTPFVLAD